MTNIRDKVFSEIDNGRLDPWKIMGSCLKYMSCDDIKGMLKANYISLEDDKEQQDADYEQNESIRSRIAKGELD